MSGLIGVLGGSFDPVHEAHLAIAAAAVDRLGFERVHFLVAPSQPHKQGRIHAAAAHRFAMVALATAPRREWIPEPLDLDVAGPCFTVDSLPRFCRHYGLDPRRVVFLAGADSLRDFPLWKSWETLIRDFRFLFFRRSGVTLDPAAMHLPGGRIVADLGALADCPLPESGAGYVAAELPDTSSTDLRSVLQCKTGPPPGLPPAVFHYIQKTRLYLT